MPLLSTILTALVGIEHIYILLLEMFLWTTPRGLRTFKLTPSFAQQTRVLAANQGLYNGFLAAGLFWSLLHERVETAWELKVFFLGCVVMAAVFGGFTANGRILVVQGVPAAGALGAVLAGL